MVLAGNKTKRLLSVNLTTKLIHQVSGLDCIPVMVPKNCEPELSYIIGELCTKCLKESCFTDCWKVSLVVHMFKNVREKSTAKTTALLVFFHW